MTRTARLTRETYGFRGPREPALTRLMGAELYIFDTPARNRLELDTDLSGEPVSWVAQDPTGPG